MAWEEDVQRIGCYDSGYFPHRGAGSQALGNGAVGDGMAVWDVLQHGSVSLSVSEASPFKPVDLR